MGSILNDADRTAIRQRIGSVTSASVPRWGRMDAKDMLNHLRQSALMALGELPVACKSKRAFQVFPIKHLIRTITYGSSGHSVRDRRGQAGSLESVTNRDVALLAFKLLGLWLIANAAIGIAGIPYYWEPQFEGVRLTVFFTVLPVLVALGIGVPVWFSADWFAARVFPTESEPTDLETLRAQPVLAVASCILGLVFVGEALPVLVNGAALFTQSRFTGSSVLGPDVDQQRLIWSAAAKANVTAGVARLLIGLAFLAGPVRLSAALARIRKELTGTLDDDAAAGPTGRVAVEQPDAPDERASSSKPPAGR